MGTTRTGGSRLGARVGRGELASVQGAIWCVGESELSGSEQRILGPEIRWLSQPFVLSFVKHVSDALCVPGPMQGFGNKEISEM